MTFHSELQIVQLILEGDVIVIQQNPSVTDTIGNQHFVPYSGCIPRLNLSRERVWNKTLTRFINSRKWAEPLTKTPSACIIICSAVSPFLVGQNEWPMDHLLRMWSRVMADAMLSCLWPCHSSYCHSSDPLHSSRHDSPCRVQTAIWTNYMCLHVYWFAVVFRLLALGVLQMNELYEH